MSDQNKIKAKIAALLAKAKGTDNEHEADTFLAKVMELLDQHQLSIEDVECQEDAVVWHKGLDCTKWTASWQADIYSALSRLYGCRAVKVRMGKGYLLELVGRESAVITTDLMFPWIKEQVNTKGRELFKAGDASDAAQGARLVGNALVGRIWKLIRENEAKQDLPKTDAIGKNKLVVQDQVLAKLEAIYGVLKAVSSKTCSTSAPARELAGGIGLHRQAGGARNLTIGHG